jgi:nucleoid DNA-binding protein
MNKKELVDSLAKKFELTNTKSDEVIKHILRSITDSLSKNKPAVFIGFGTFSVKKRAARNGRNPKTGEAMKIAARRVVRFSVGKNLKAVVNKK